jgi:poly(A) polymerase
VSDAPSIERALSASGQLEPARRVLAGQPGSFWVVGGAIRDALRGEPVGEIDLATDTDPRSAARALARATDAHCFELSDRHSSWRVTDRDREWTIDLAALRAETIEADLRLRDFTANAIAVPLAGGPPLDPCGGAADIEAGVLRAVGERSFGDDPLRLMRAARLGAALGFEIDPGTVSLARESADRAAEPAGERQFAELRAMLTGPDPLRALELLDELGAGPRVLPELAGLRGVAQSANHHLDVHEHTVEVLRRWLEVESDLERYAGEHADAVAELLAEPLADELDRRGGIRFATILHDIGKPATRTERDGFVGFRGHDAAGAEMVVELARRFRTSRRFADYQAALTRHHLILGFMVVERPLSRRRIWDYLSATGTEALDVTLLTVADRLSAQGPGVPQEAIDGHLALAREMIGEIVALERAGGLRPLLNGDEVGALLGIEPGPAIGAAMRELAAAQFAGEVADREQAEAHLLAWHAEG